MHPGTHGLMCVQLRVHSIPKFRAVPVSSEWFIVHTEAFSDRAFYSANKCTVMRMVESYGYTRRK